MTDNARTFGPARITLERCLEPHRPQIVQALANYAKDLEKQLRETREMLRASAGELSSLKREPGEFVGPIQQKEETAGSPPTSPLEETQGSPPTSPLEETQGSPPAPQS